MINKTLLNIKANVLNMRENIATYEGERVGYKREHCCTWGRTVLNMRENVLSMIQLWEGALIGVVGLTL